jgi:hypothetical protein
MIRTLLSIAVICIGLLGLFATSKKDDQRIPSIEDNLGSVQGKMWIVTRNEIISRFPFADSCQAGVVFIFSTDKDKKFSADSSRMACDPKNKFVQGNWSSNGFELTLMYPNSTAVYSVLTNQRDSFVCQFNQGSFSKRLTLKPL